MRNVSGAARNAKVSKQKVCKCRRLDVPECRIVKCKSAKIQQWKSANVPKCLSAKSPQVCNNAAVQRSTCYEKYECQSATVELWQCKETSVEVKKCRRVQVWAWERVIQRAKLEMSPCVEVEQLKALRRARCKNVGSAHVCGLQKSWVNKWMFAEALLCKSVVSMQKCWSDQEDEPSVSVRGWSNFKVQSTCAKVKMCEYLNV